ncbi:MAG: amidohydrolase family protein [Lentisphaerae bacterium]|nr:amidohydrolase family protein [Lentisphaerota bacterium]
MKIFDALVSYGPCSWRPTQEKWRLADLVADMDYVGISGALVRHAQCYSHDAMAGNRRLVKEIAAERERLFPCWVVGPHHMGDFPTPAVLLREMDKCGVRAVQILPARHNYPVHEDFLGELAAALNERQVPVLVYNEDMHGNYEAWKTLCGMFHNCPIIMAGSNWGEWRLVDGCMRAVPNLYLLFHRFQGHRAVEEIAARFGVERCLFGSGLPQMSGGAARAFVDWSFLPQGGVSAFAGGNLARLLGVKLSALPDVPAAADPVMAAARQGKAVAGRVLDAHCHVLDNGGCGVGAGYVMPEGDAAGILRVFDRCGINGVAMMTWQGPVGLDAAAGNELMHRIVKKHGERVLGVTSVDPLHQDKATMLRALRQGLRKGFPGIKPYWPRNRIAYNDALYDPCWEFANKYGLYALLHTSGDRSGVASVIDIARRYPDASFLIAHSCGGWDYAELVAEACQAVPNIYAEITLTPVPNGIIEWMCGAAGVDRVLFGTDAPMRDPRPQLGWVVNSRLSVADKQRVLGDNFAAVLARIKWPDGKSLLPQLFKG